MLIEVRHTTRYRYGEAVSHALQRLRLTPVTTSMQRVLDWQIDAPGIGEAVRYVDAFGNVTHLTVGDAPADGIELVARGRVETTDTHGVLGQDAARTPPWVFLRQTASTEVDDALVAFAGELPAGSELDRLHALMAAIHARIAFDTDATHANTNAREAFACGRGVCQDHSHVLIGVARHLGIPARYVTGYLYQPDELTSLAHHAWAEAYLPDLGWVGFDAANGASPDDRYIRLACGFDAAAAAPVVGARRGGGVERLDVAVELRAAAQSSQ